MNPVVRLLELHSLNSLVGGLLPYLPLRYRDAL